MVVRSPSKAATDQKPTPPEAATVIVGGGGEEKSERKKEKGALREALKTFGLLLPPRFPRGGAAQPSQSTKPRKEQKEGGRIS